MLYFLPRCETDHGATHRLAIAEKLVDIHCVSYNCPQNFRLLSAAPEKRSLFNSQTDLTETHSQTLRPYACNLRAGAPIFFSTALKPK